MKQIFILINLQLVFFTFIYSNDLQKVYYPLKTSEKINIDGNLSDGAWINTIFLSDFIQIDPNFKLKSDVSSNVKIIYNDNSLYFGIVLYDDMNSVKFKSGEYDDWENTFEEDSDYFSIEIDSFNDKQSAFIFTINSSGVRADSKYYNGFYDDSWDANWNSAVRVHNDMWIIEVEIPIVNLHFNNSENLSMGINFSRYKYSSNSYDVWSKKIENWTFFGPWSTLAILC